MGSMRNSYKVLISCLEIVTGRKPLQRPWCKRENSTNVVRKFRVTKFDALFGTFPRMAKILDIRIRHMSSIPA